MPFHDCPQCEYWDSEFEVCFNPGPFCPDPDDPESDLR